MYGLRQQMYDMRRIGRCWGRRRTLIDGLHQIRQGQCRLFWLSGPPPSNAHNATTSARRSRLEAVLFLAREPLSLRKLAQFANLTDGTEARTVLRSLEVRYDERQCAFQVFQ